jgi:hypothetical protein
MYPSFFCFLQMPMAVMRRNLSQDKKHASALVPQRTPNCPTQHQHMTCKPDRCFFEVVLTVLVVSSLIV